MPLELGCARILDVPFISKGLFSPSKNEIFMNFLDFTKGQNEMDLVRKEQVFWCGCQTWVLSKIIGGGGGLLCMQTFKAPAGIWFQWTWRSQESKFNRVERRKELIRTSFLWAWWKIFKLGYGNGGKNLYIKIRWIVFFKWMNYGARKLDLNKAIEKKVMSKNDHRLTQGSQRTGLGWILSLS